MRANMQADYSYGDSPYFKWEKKQRRGTDWAVSASGSIYICEQANTEKPVNRWGVDGLHNTGNYLLSHGSEAVLPSATESLTSVFEMGTCVSSRLWSPESICCLLCAPGLFIGKSRVWDENESKLHPLDNPYLKKAHNCCFQAFG